MRVALRCVEVAELHEAGAHGGVPGSHRRVTGHRVTFRRPTGAATLECPVRECMIVLDGAAGFHVVRLIEPGGLYAVSFDETGSVLSVECFERGEGLVTQQGVSR